MARTGARAPCEDEGPAPGSARAASPAATDRVPDVALAMSPEVVAFALTQGGRARVRLYGHSMRPLLRAGMIVDIVPLAGRPKLGEILVFEAAGRLVAHRLIAIRSAGYVTCGDAQPAAPEIVLPTSVLGRVAGVWKQRDVSLRRVDRRWFALAGATLLLTRRPRALLARVVRRLPRR